MTSCDLLYNQLNQEITTANTTPYFSVQVDFGGHRQEDIATPRIQSANSKFLQSPPQRPQNSTSPIRPLQIPATGS